ncbi:HesA/MoeB/ThiF family protein [Poritiphilus flavus]|uniref:Molybdopterin-synthase adenylyltransferase n=1 Tax=Poritiphilus flavus TaxID=2697053 RepID=A0A6L9EEN5_9FLAO|nr:HesA/MoeB/ThiF family protein [Poritiphilus flavus]NAS13220.1 sulfurtransferase [Poritiphilus flavus]
MTEERYNRQITLKDFGPKAQKTLGGSSVLVVGLGGLGVPVLQYLNAMGVGSLGLIDQDTVELANLQRQVLYSEEDLGRPKLQVALQKLKAQNSETNFHTYDSFLVRENALEIIENYDVVVDATDNFATRYLINDCCVMLNKPFVYGALHGFEGQVSVFNYKGGPSYRCLFPDPPANNEIPNCDDNGILGVVPGIVGNLQALETVKVLTGVGEVLSGQLLLFNGLNQSFQKIRFKPKEENLKISALEETYDIPICHTVPTVSSEELKKLLDGSKFIQLIDVRSFMEFDDYHLQGSHNIPIDELENRLMEIDFDHEIYFLCQSGKRSEVAARIALSQYPSAAVFHISGGLNRYSAVFS